MTAHDGSMPKLGASHFKKFEGDHFDFCRFANEAGFRAIELKFEPWLDLQVGLSARAPRVLEYTRANALEVSVHAAYDGGLNIAAPDHDLRHRSAKAYRDSLEYAARIGARCLTAHGGHLLREEDWARQIPALEDRTIVALADLQERARGDGITICVENRHNFSQEKIRYPVTPPELRECLRALGANARATVDSGHAHSVRGTTLLAFVESVGPENVALTHLHDNDGSADEHLVPGEGKVDFLPFLRAWNREAWSFPLMFELNRIDDFITARDRVLGWLAEQSAPSLGSGRR